MSVIYLVRHGQACFGSNQYDQLSQTGCEQVRLLGAYLASLPPRIDHIYSGTLHRQQQTAQLLATALAPDGPPLSIDPAFDEYDSEAILRSYAATLSTVQLDAAGWPDLAHDRRRFQLFLERAARAWVEARIAACDLPTWCSFRDRLTSALHGLMQTHGRSQTVLISSSGGVIATIVAHVLGLADHRGIELNWAIHNASLTRLIYNADKVSLSMFNALPHLDRPGLRELITYR